MCYTVSLFSKSYILNSLIEITLITITICYYTISSTYLATTEFQNSLVKFYLEWYNRKVFFSKWHFNNCNGNLEIMAQFIRNWSKRKWSKFEFILIAAYKLWHSFLAIGSHKLSSHTCFTKKPCELRSRMGCDSFQICAACICSYVQQVPDAWLISYMMELYWHKAFIMQHPQCFQYRLSFGVCSSFFFLIAQPLWDDTP